MSQNISFISESTIEENKKQRLEEWQKNRKEDDPLEPPEPEYDPRTLYERLQEQKLKKREEYEESRKMKNLVKGLDNDEIEFLNIIDNSKAELENQKYKEEMLALEEYKQGVAHLNTEEQNQKLLEFKKELFQKHKKRMENHKPKKSQADLLMGAIKRKSTGKDEDSEKKKSKIETETKPIESPKPTIQCIGRLPGIGNYSNDSDSDSDQSNDSDCDDFPVFAYKMEALKANCEPEH